MSGNPCLQRAFCTELLCAGVSLAQEFDSILKQQNSTKFKECNKWNIVKHSETGKRREPNSLSPFKSLQSSSVHVATAALASF
jgi:hypothetical protein